jgi:vitamin B12 transporter
MIRRAVCVAGLSLSTLGALSVARTAEADDAAPPRSVEERAERDDRVERAAPLEVEVRGEAISAPPREPSVAGSVIREERLRAPGLEAGDVLRTQPGIAVLETGGYGSPSTASMRGATASETPVYLAGIRLNDDAGGAADLSLVPLWLVRRVEIYRSNAPLEGDQLGLGGAIFFEPRRPHDTEVGAGIMAGSFGAHAAWTYAGFGGDGASGLVGVRLDGARNDYTFVNDAGTRFEPSNFRTVARTNADTRTGDAWAIGSVRLGRGGRVDLVANDVERDAGLPGVNLFPSTLARVSQRRQLAGLTTTVPCAGDASAAAGEANRTCVVTATAAALVTQARYDDPLRQVALGTTALEFDATRVEAGLLVHWSLSDRVTLTPALRASVERMTIAAAGAATAHTGRVFGRAALQGQWTLSDVATLRALGSVECNGTSQDGVPPWSLPGDVAAGTAAEACKQFEPAGRIGAELGHRPLALLATVGRYARVPTLTELFGISGAVRGNTALVAETGLSVEAGVRATGPSTGALRGAAVDLFAFERLADNLVAYQRSSLGYVRPYNLGSARVAGVELLASYSPARFALFELSATVLDPRNTSAVRPANDVLPYQPRLALVPRVELRARVHAGPVDSAKLVASYFYESSRYADPAGLVVIPEQGSLDLEAEVGALEDRLALRARLVNLLDQTRFDLIGYPLPGRAAYAALEAKW